MKTVGRKLVAGLMTMALALTATLSIGAVNVRAADNGQVMWRLYNPNSGEHFYTANGAERNNLISAGWNYEGAGFIASGSTPVYRMYNANVGDHHYTTNSAEKDMLVSVGWQYEGIGWNTESNGFSVYRLYNPNAVTATHHYTLDEAEKNHLVSIGWKYEGVSFNSLHKIATENINQPTCVATGYSGDVVCQDVDMTYSGSELPINPNNHARIQHQDEVFDSFCLGPEVTYCDDGAGEGCGAYLINGVWTKDQTVIQAYYDYALELLQLKWLLTYGVPW